MLKEDVMSVIENENYLEIKLIGKFVGDEETDILKNELEEISASDKKKVVLNFQYVTYFSSLALGILVKEDENLTLKGGMLIICNVPGFLENIFTLTKLSNILNIVHSLDDAVKMVNSEK